MALRLGTVLPHLVDSIQAAFQTEKRTSNVTRLVQDLIDHCEENGLSGILAFCDQEKAYDRVNWDFLFAVLKRMNIPDDFINLVKLLLHDNILNAKVNGHLGAPFQPSNGVKQRCGLSPLLYILVIQTLLSLIHTADGPPGSDTAPYEGIAFPTARRGDTDARTHSLASAYADELIAYLKIKRNSPLSNAS